MKTMKNSKIMMFSLTVFILISSFSIAFGEGIETFRAKVNENIVTEKWGSEKTHVTVPGGIVFLDDFIYVTDKEEGTIVVLDREGNFQNKSSADDLFLIEPTVIKTDGESLYVIDSGINQLKILSKNFELLKSIKLPEPFSRAEYWDFEIIDKKIYLSSESLFKTDMAIYELNKSGMTNKITHGFIGYLSNFNGELTAVNSLVHYKNANTQGAKSGKNSLFKVKDDKLKSEFKFVDRYIPLDFLLADNYIYVFSAAAAGIDKYTADGQYVETLLQFEEPDLFVQLTLCNNSILLAFPFEKAIYKIDLN